MSIKESAKQDKRKWLESAINDIEKAGNTGDSKSVFRGVANIAGKKGGAPASLDGIDSNIWVNFFTDLLGKAKNPEEVTDEALKRLTAWRICEDKMKPERRENTWDINLAAPDEKEIFDVLGKCRRDKSVSGIIPTELWRESEGARKILTVFIRKVWEGAAPPEEWLLAELVLLYKQKGLKTDPNSYRGISLLSSAEKVISMVILARIKPALEKVLHVRQAGFRTGKSCRNAVFILMRELEKCLREGKPMVYNFVDFKKAFDSLDWSVMWQVMEAQGMPNKIVNIIKELYNNATIAVRLNMEGGIAKAFPQKVGIRQGCALSPAIFVLVLNFALKSYMEACEELGIKDADWLGYADDLAIGSNGVENAEKAFHQLQAACAFVGLHCNVDKTECMARGICKPKEVVPDIHMATKERIAVTLDKSNKREGWIVDWVARKKMAKEEELKLLESKFKPDFPSHLIIYDPKKEGDTPDLMAVQDRGSGGWLMDQNKKKYRSTRLGGVEYVDEKQNKIRCETCGVFMSERARSSHLRFCRKWTDMTIEEQAKRRRTRTTNSKRAGKARLRVEHIQIADITGRLLKAVAEFKYLGTLVTSDGGSSKEITKRLALAGSVFARLGKIWMTGDISFKLKCRLYFAIIMTVLLYNGECWTVTKFDLNRLEGFHFRCVRRMTRKIRNPDMDDECKDDHATHEEVFRAAEIPRIADMLREKRLRWVGHLAREDEDDPARKILLKEMEGKSQWWTQVENDLKTTGGVTVKNVLKKAADKPMWRKISSCSYDASRRRSPNHRRRATRR